MVLAQGTVDVKLNKMPDVALYGVKSLDDQHEDLFGIVEELSQFSNTVDLRTVNALFDRLQDLLARHFKDEERLMLETRFPETHAHRTHHRVLLSEVSQIRKRITERGEMSKQDAHESMDRIVRHMLLADGPFNTHLKRIGYRESHARNQKASFIDTTSLIVSNY